MQTNQLEQRKHAHLAVAHLECILEECVSNSEAFDELDEKINEFKKRLFEESSIA